MRIFIAMSGGVDSSVVAALLKQQGHNITGVYLKVWSPELEDVMGGCPWEEDVQAVTAVGRHLGIPTEVWDVSKEYYDKVVEYFFDEYKKGRTPNPDVMCNREMKFGIFLKRALERGAEKIATGHYARIVDTRTFRAAPSRSCSLVQRLAARFRPFHSASSAEAMLKRPSNPLEGAPLRCSYRLLAGVDKNKDQSYFLYSLNQDQLSRTLFPLGRYTKPEVREMARKFGLPNAERKDSQGVCFIGKIPVKDFLKTRLPEKKGLLVTTDGKVVGEHEGVQYFTIGQRHGIGSPGGGTAYFVVEKNVETNTLIVAEGEDHPMLFKKELFIERMHWISGTEPSLPLDCLSRIRYRQPLEACTIMEIGNELHVIFKKPQRAVTPGQAIVLYDEDVVLGGGIII